MLLKMGKLVDALLLQVLVSMVNSIRQAQGENSSSVTTEEQISWASVSRRSSPVLGKIPVVCQTASSLQATSIGTTTTVLSWKWEERICLECLDTILVSESSNAEL